MIFRRRKSGQSSDADQRDTPSTDHAVIISLRLSGGQFGSDDERRRVLLLEDQIIEVVGRTGVGAVDGHGFGDGVAELFVYGPDADALFAAIETVLRTFNPMNGSSVLLRYGSDDDARSRTIALA